MMWQAGVDEAGRGALVGDVFAAAVILPEKWDLPKLTDSKKLTEKQRNQLALAIKGQALAWSVASASPTEIAELNILHATMLAMRRAVEGLNRLPEAVWIDGNRVPEGLQVAAQALVGGDALMPAISAASILAKTARDAQMYELDELYPQYGFAKHKGYGTAAHLVALKKWGALPEHRRDFAPVKSILLQGELF